MYTKREFRYNPKYIVRNRAGKVILMTKSINQAINTFESMPKNDRVIICDPGWINPNQKTR